MSFLISRTYPGGEIEYLARSSKFMIDHRWTKLRNDAIVFPHKFIAERVLNDLNYGFYKYQVIKND